MSRRLDLEWLPNSPDSPLWSGAVISLNGTAFYRLSAQVVVWLEKAGEQLETECLACRIDRNQLDAFFEAMCQVWSFAEQNLKGEAVKAARLNPATAELPNMEGPK